MPPTMCRSRRAKPLPPNRSRNWPARRHHRAFDHPYRIGAGQGQRNTASGLLPPEQCYRSWRHGSARRGQVPHAHHLGPSLGAESQGPWKIPGGPLTEADYKKAAQAGGFAGQIIAGTDLASVRSPQSPLPPIGSRRSAHSCCSGSRPGCAPGREDSHERASDVRHLSTPRGLHPRERRCGGGRAYFGKRNWIWKRNCHWDASFGRSAL